MFALIVMGFFFNFLTGTYNCRPHIGIYHENEGTYIKKQQQIIAQRRLELDNEMNGITPNVITSSSSSSSPSTSAWLSRCFWKLPLVTPPLELTAPPTDEAVVKNNLRQGQVPGKVVMCIYLMCLYLEKRRNRKTVVIRKICESANVCI
jgi:hypothetical protein